jgi:ribosomal peptide maturation radical SAM protein 1
MPFISALRPSIAIGLLCAIGKNHGFDVQTLHLNLDFSQVLGQKWYEALSQHRGRLFGDWLFSAAAYGAAAPDPDGEMLTEFAEDAKFFEGVELDRDELLQVRRELVPRYLARLRDEIPWRDYDVVGFTTTFQQTMASAALASEIRTVHPGVKIVFGGANLDGDMGSELVRALPQIDFGISGEADHSFPAFLDALAREQSPHGIPGVIVRRGEEIMATPPAPPLESLDELPTPDYQEFFERLERLQQADNEDTLISIPFESSRGCWWGAKKHCSFCGLNGSTMKYRSKSAERVLEELAQLAARHRGFRLVAVDNIMDHNYLKTLLQKLRVQDNSYRIFYEIKSNVGRDEMRTMQQAGVTAVQPGIESLSSPILRLMRKGVRAIQNVNMMRWAKYYGLHTGWNLIWGFPGEQREDYLQQAQLMKLLFHLDPPGGVGPVWLERFSPLFRERDAFPLARLAPERSYHYVYPQHVDLDRLAYFFDFELENTLPKDSLPEVEAAAKEWQERASQTPEPALWFRRAPGYVEVDDQRHADKWRLHHFEGPLADLYFAASDHPVKPQQLKERLGLDYSVAQIAHSLDEFCARGLMMHDEGSYLSLALPAGAPR